MRVVAKVDAFHEVWLLLRGLSESVRTLSWTIVVMFFVTYVFAVFGVVLISVDLKKAKEAMDPADERMGELEDLNGYFDGIFSTMYTMIQVMTLDSWNGIARPLQTYIGWSWVYFYAYISIAVIVLLNLVTAIIVDNALKSSKKDEEQLLQIKDQEKKKVIDQCRQLFEMMDRDGNGELTETEFDQAFEVPEVRTKLRMLNFEQEKCKELFRLLDSGDGVLSVTEFFEGIMKMDGPATARDSFKLLKLVEKMFIQQFGEDPFASRARSTRQSPTASSSVNISPSRRNRRELSLDSYDNACLGRMVSGNSTQSRVDDVSSQFAHVNSKVELLAGELAGIRCEVSALVSGLGGIADRATMSASSVTL